MNSILRLNLALDFTALAIPVIVIWKVQLTWKKKARIFGLLSIGLIACIASVMTLISQYTLEKDPLWNYTTLLAWIMVELVVSLAAACAPTLAYLLPRSMFTRHDASYSASRLTGRMPNNGLGSALSKNEYALRTRIENREDDFGEEEERRIIVKDTIKIEWQDNKGHLAQGSQLGDHLGDGGSLASWESDQRRNSGAVIYDGRHQEEATRAWASTNASGKNDPGGGPSTSHAI
jgi:hypothetical protein